MQTRLIAVTIPMLLAAAAFGQEKRYGVVIPPNYGLKVPVQQAPQSGQQRAVAPRSGGGFGVRAVAPRPQAIGNQTRAGIPFTRLGPTARTMYDAERERRSQQGRTQPQRPRPTDQQLSPDQRLRFEFRRPEFSRNPFERTPIAPLDVRRLDVRGNPVEPLDVRQRGVQELDVNRPELLRQDRLPLELDRDAVRPLPTTPMRFGDLPQGPMELSPTPGMDNAPAFEHNLQGPLTAGFVVRDRAGNVVQAPWWYGAGLADWHRVPTWGVVSAGTGFYAHSLYDDGRFRLRFRSGGPLVRLRDGVIGSCSTGNCAGGVCYTTPLVGSTIYGSYLSVGDTSSVDPQIAVAIPQAEPVTYGSEAERGEALLSAGHAKDAAQVLRAYLSTNPHDAHAMRSLGLAMIAENQVRDGIAMVGLAYKSDPALAAYPIAEDAVGSRAELRRVLERVSIHANRANMPSGWLTLAALMQAENRTPLAARMVERARRAGLEPEVAAQMEAALRY